MKKPSAATVIAALAFAVSMAVVLASSSSAEAVTWGAPVDVAATTGNSSQQIAVAPDGAATAVWSHFDGTNYIIQAATRPAGSNTWGTLDVLSVTGQNNTYPQIAIAADGSATAIWASDDRICAATRPAGSNTWGPPVEISMVSTFAYLPQIAIAADGAATAVWYADDGSGGYVIQAATRPAGGSWPDPAVDTPVNLSVVGEISFYSEIAIASDGSATVVWQHSEGPSGYSIQAATRPAGSNTWGAPAVLSATGEDAQNPQIAIASDGTATVVWQRQDGLSVNSIQAATRPAGSNTWGIPAVLSAMGEDARYPKLAIASDGSATVVWHNTDGFAVNSIQAATRPAGSNTWGTSSELYVTLEDAQNPQIAIAFDGSTTVVWAHEDVYSAHTVQAATRPAGGSWPDPVADPPADLSAAGLDARYPQIAVAPDGATTVVWGEVGSGLIQAVTRAAPTSALLIVSTAGSGSGSVVSSLAGISCGATCSASFTLSSTVTLTATPASGSTFAGWSGACTGTSTTCSVTITGATSATATFTVDSAAPTTPGAAAATTASTPTATAAAPTPPSNRFRALSSRTVGTSIITSIRLPSAGRVTQRGVYRRVSSARRAACTATETVTRATTVTLICHLEAVATRRAVVVTTTFTPTGGTARTTTRTVVVSPPPALPGVTG
ncbi:MAG: hypothetical protein WCN97_00825 [Thermoleophilia bacterium]